MDNVKIAKELVYIARELISDNSFKKGTIFTKIYKGKITRFKVDFSNKKPYAVIIDSNESSWKKRAVGPFPSIENLQEWAESGGYTFKLLSANMDKVKNLEGLIIKIGNKVSYVDRTNIIRQGVVEKITPDKRGSNYSASVWIKNGPIIYANQVQKILRG